MFSFNQAIFYFIFFTNVWKCLFTKAVGVEVILGKVWLSLLACDWVMDFGGDEGLFVGLPFAG